VLCLFLKGYNAAEAIPYNLAKLHFKKGFHITVTSYSKSFHFPDAKTRVVISDVQIVVVGIHGIATWDSVNSNINKLKKLYTKKLSTDIILAFCL
jgi:hypothetical protein